MRKKTFRMNSRYVFVLKRRIGELISQKENNRILSVKHRHTRY